MVADYECQTIVGINSWVAHRDASIFGPDANQFKPERWLTSDKEKLSLMERNWMPVCHPFHHSDFPSLLPLSIPVASPSLALPCRVAFSRLFLAGEYHVRHVS